MARVADGDAAEALDPLGEQVDQLELLLGVLVEQQVELVEGRAGDQPVVLLVQRVQDHRVGEDLVEQLAALARAFVRQADRQAPERAERLDLGAVGTSSFGSGFARWPFAERAVADGRVVVVAMGPPLRSLSRHLAPAIHRLRPTRLAGLSGSSQVPASRSTTGASSSTSPTMNEVIRGARAGP